MFINFSNHPLSAWSKAQLDAAVKLGSDLSGLNEVQEWKFPDVPPTATTAEVEALAAAEVEAMIDALALDKAHGQVFVMIQGEATFAHAAVKYLWDVGCVPVAACSERIVETLPDGRVIRDFRFIQFREYPVAKTMTVPAAVAVVSRASQKMRPIHDEEAIWAINEFIALVNQGFDEYRAGESNK